MKKLVTYEIENCNHTCIHFYHKFEDMENVWCAKSNKKIFDYRNGETNLEDYKKRAIPKECPLKDAL